jgi:periplasmic protein TonB
MKHRRAEAPRDDVYAVKLDNVIPFVPPRDSAFPHFAINAAERPAPDDSATLRRRWWIGFLVASLLAHALIAAVLFQRTPDPVAGIGLEAIPVEVVFGADAPAGIASAPSEEEAQPQPAETAEVPVAKQPPAEPEPVAETPSTPPPEELQQEPREQEPREQETKEEDRESKKEEAPPPSHAAAGVGRGQSRSDANYQGLVAAHLARHKRFPQGVQSKRSQGTAVVAFSLDGRGRVIAVKLARPSGVAALDQEAQAIVRRASPFPAPPSGGTVEFTVPLNFQIR